MSSPLPSISPVVVAVVVLARPSNPQIEASTFVLVLVVVVVVADAVVALVWARNLISSAFCPAFLSAHCRPLTAHRPSFWHCSFLAWRRAQPARPALAPCLRISLPHFPCPAPSPSPHPSGAGAASSFKVDGV